MSVISPAYITAGGSHDAKNVRAALSLALGAPVQTFAGGIQATTGGGAHGVLGDGLAVSEKSGTPNMSVDVAAGLAAVTGTSTLAQGTWPFLNDAVENLVVAAADATNPRNDLVVAQIRDNEGDGGGNADARLHVITGTPAASPTDPAVLPGCLVLARINVAASVTSITDAAIDDLRTFCSAGITECTTATLPTGAGRWSGRVVYDRTVDRMLRWDGTYWRIVGGAMPACTVRRTAAQSVPSLTFTDVNFGASSVEVIDTDGFHGSADSFLEIPAGLGGLYQVTGEMEWAFDNSNRRVMRVQTANNTVANETDSWQISHDPATPSGAFTSQIGSRQMLLSAGTELVLSGYQGTGSALNIEEGATLAISMIRHEPSLS